MKIVLVRLAGRARAYVGLCGVLTSIHSNLQYSFCLAHSLLTTVHVSCPLLTRTGALVARQSLNDAMGSSGGSGR